MPKYTKRPMPPKEEAQLREAVIGQADLKAMLDYIAMMAEVDLDALNDDGQEVSDDSLEEVQ